MKSHHTRLTNWSFQRNRDRQSRPLVLIILLSLIVITGILAAFVPSADGYVIKGDEDVFEDWEISHTPTDPATNDTITITARMKSLNSIQSVDLNYCIGALCIAMPPSLTLEKEENGYEYYSHSFEPARFTTDQLIKYNVTIIDVDDNKLVTDDISFTVAASGQDQEANSNNDSPGFEMISTIAAIALFVVGPALIVRHNTNTNNTNKNNIKHTTNDHIKRCGKYGK